MTQPAHPTPAEHAAARRDNGGPAFPESYGDIRNQCNSGGVSGGMSLRDYFAAKAMHAFLTSGEANPRKCAEWSYGQADAMLAARNQP